MVISVVRVQSSEILRIRSDRFKKQGGNRRRVYTEGKYGVTDVKSTGDAFTETTKAGLDTGEVGGWTGKHRH